MNTCLHVEVGCSETGAGKGSQVTQEAGVRFITPSSSCFLLGVRPWGRLAPCRMGGNQKVEVQKLVGSDKGSLTGRAEPEHAGKSKGIHSLLPASDRFWPSQESWAPSPVTVTWEHPLPPSCPALIAELGLLWSGRPLWSLRVGCVPSQLLVHPSPTLVGQGEEQKRP